jgi:hypothetical protein
MTCPHPTRQIDGVYSVGNIPVAVGWTCTVCKSSGATKWADATREQRAEARLVELSRNATCEMSVWGK